MDNFLVITKSVFCCGIPLALFAMFALSLIKSRGANSNYTEFDLTQENFYNFFGVDKK